MTHLAGRFSRHESERRDLVGIANAITAAHGGMDPHLTPEVVFDALHEAHGRIREAIRAHDRAHRT